MAGVLSTLVLVCGLFAFFQLPDILEGCNETKLAVEREKTKQMQANLEIKRLEQRSTSP